MNCTETNATAAEARRYLRAAAATETGRAALKALGYEDIVAAPDRGDDNSTVAVAVAVRQLLHRNYGI